MSDTSGNPVVVWFRTDLRVQDNLALNAAAETRRPIVFVYVHDYDTALRQRGGAQTWWLHHSLVALTANLSKLGARLILRSGNSSEQIKQIVIETNAHAVFWNRRYEPAVIARDAERAVGLLKVHIARTAELVGAALEGHGADQGGGLR